MILLLYCTSFSTYSQSLVQGTIHDEEKKTVTGVVVSVIDKQSSMIGYGITDEFGMYAIKIDSDIKQLQLIASAMGYESVIIDINNESQTKNITLKITAFQLKELIVQSDRIWKRNDTIVYSVDAFKNTQDRTIGDLLKKLPGVEVLESGAIKYQGESINKFYIEGMDLMESKYGLATNNLPVDAVQNVEVIENHQPIKSLSETVFSEKAAINLKLKNGKMGHPVGNVIAGVGVEDKDWLWLLNIFGLQANKTNQTIAMYKTNNAGVDITKEINDHIFETGVSNLTDKILFRENIMTDMSLEDQRYLFNQSHLFTINHLRKINKDRQIRVNANYLYDERKETVEQSFSYYSPVSPLLIQEISRPVRNANQENIAVTYVENSEKFYLYNKLDTKLKWDKSDNPIFSYENAAQYYSLHDYKVGNDLQLVKNMGQKIWNITSKINYTHKPQMLIVNDDHYEKLQTQNINYKGIYTDLQSSYSISNRSSLFRVNAKIMNLNEQLRSDLQSSLITDSTKNQLASNHSQLTFTPQYQWNNRKTKVILEADIVQNILSVDNKYYQKIKGCSPFFITPKATINRIINPYWESTFTYSYNQQLGDILDFTSGYVQYDYRNYGFKTAVLSERKKHLLSLKFNYKNVLKALFFNTSFTYIGFNKNLLNMMQYTNTVTLNTNLYQNNHSTNWMWYGYIGKYINIINSNFSLSTNLSLSEYQKIQQKELYPINNTNYNLIATWITKLSDALNISYNGTFSHNILKINSKDEVNKNKNQQLSQKLSFYYLLNSHWALSVQGEHLYTKLSNDNKKNVIFGDIHIKYLHPDFDISVTWNNVFNQKQYKTTVYDELNIYTYNYKLRPGNLLVSIVYKY